MPDVFPGDVTAAADGVGEAVETVSGRARTGAPRSVSVRRMTWSALMRLGPPHASPVYDPGVIGDAGRPRSRRIHSTRGEALTGVQPQALAVRASGSRRSRRRAWRSSRLAQALGNASSLVSTAANSSGMPSVRPVANRLEGDGQHADTQAAQVARHGQAHAGDGGLDAV